MRRDSEIMQFSSCALSIPTTLIRQVDLRDISENYPVAIYAPPQSSRIVSYVPVFGEYPDEPGKATETI